MTAVGLNAPDTVAKYGRATVHSLRHTFASWLIQNGADLGEVAGALSHASLNMTKRYAHLSKGATLAKLGGILNDISVSGVPLHVAQIASRLGCSGSAASVLR